MSDVVQYLIAKNRHEFSEQANHRLMHEQYYRLFPDRVPLPMPPQQLLQRGANGRFVRAQGSANHQPTKAELQARKEREEKHEARLAALEKRMQGTERQHAARDDEGADEEEGY